ncbi:MAG: hypothetical protein HY852_06375 [Bradyrhizobium sp.]|uniref:hypothetical protein n=1 Tax=Bradyrhizobium sp. TaxID=376 RepID=UPI0025BE88A3|nr:hypothetical protein [Bradyrhizobium sp.]MBI5261428.1 hypothetical protein [Bradyrhizobium sp.]
MDAASVDQWFATHVTASPLNGNDVIVTLDNDSILLKNVALPNLQASDFIVAPHPI